MSTMAVFHEAQIASDESAPFAYRGMLMSRLKLLQIALFAFGIIFCLVYPLAIVWPSGWAWHDGPPAASHYFMMIVGIYATLGMFLVRASRDPVANRSLIGLHDLVKRRTRADYGG